MGSAGRAELQPGRALWGASLGGGPAKLGAHRCRSDPSCRSTGGRSHEHLGAEQRACAAPRNTNQTKTPALEAQGGISPWLPASGASLTGGSLSTRAAARELWLQRQRRSGIPPAPREVAVGFTPGHQNHSGAGGEAGQGTASILCP